MYVYFKELQLQKLARELSSVHATRVYGPSIRVGH